MSPEDRRLLTQFAARVRALEPKASISAFGSRARGTASPESDLDLCVVLPEVTRALRDAVYEIAWEIGFEAGCVLTAIILSEEAFELTPPSASTLAANIRRDGIAA